MADHRCRWCGDWLLPARYGGSGESYCGDECHVASLNYQLDIPSPYDPANARSMSAIGATMSEPGSASTLPALAHSPQYERTTR